MGPLSRRHVNEMNFGFGVKGGHAIDALGTSVIPPKSCRCRCAAAIVWVVPKDEIATAITRCAGAPC
jgi:hypothetical protein